MEFDELLDERQADTEAFLVHPAIGCDLRENVENPSLLFGCDTDAVIGDLDLGPPIL